MNPQQVKIAVVSNDDTQASTATQALEGKGYQVGRYKSADDVLAEVSARTTHVVLVDEDSFGDSGALDLIGKLRDADRQQHPILMGSKPSLDVAIKAMQLGVSDYIAKPVHVDRVQRSIEVALSKRGMFLTSPETINKIIGARLRDIRRDCDLTTQQLADRVGVTQSQISQIETGRSAASVVTLYRISHALGMSLSKLLEGI